MELTRLKHFNHIAATNIEKARFEGFEYGFTAFVKPEVDVFFDIQLLVFLIHRNFTTRRNEGNAFDCAIIVHCYLQGKQNVDKDSLDLNQVNYMLASAMKELHYKWISQVGISFSIAHFRQRKCLQWGVGVMCGGYQTI